MTWVEGQNRIFFALVNICQFVHCVNIMYYSYVEIEYVATSFSPSRMDLAVKLLIAGALRLCNCQCGNLHQSKVVCCCLDGLVRSLVKLFNHHCCSLHSTGKIWSLWLLLAIWCRTLNIDQRVNDVCHCSKFHHMCFVRLQLLLAPLWCDMNFWLVVSWCNLMLPVGTLNDRYLCKVTLPRAPRIQSADHVTCHIQVTRDNPNTSYSQVPRIPTWSNLTRLLACLEGTKILPFKPAWLM